MNKKRQQRLDRAAVLQGAREVLSETGIDAFTTRKLAAHLHVQQPALYWHFPTKADLLIALATEMLTSDKHASLPEPDESWQTFLMRNARSFRDMLNSVRDGARLHAEFYPAPSDNHLESDAPKKQIRFLTKHGFSKTSAIRALMAISRYVVGVTLEEQSSEFAAASESARDEDFEFGLRALVTGLRP